LDPPLRAQDLAGTTLITLPSGAGTIRILDEWLVEHQVNEGPRLSCENLGAVAGMLREGLGVGFLPRAWAELLIARGDLVALSHFPPLRPLTYTFQWRRDDTRPMMQQLREIAAQTIDFRMAPCVV